MHKTIFFHSSFKGHNIVVVVVVVVDGKLIYHSPEVVIPMNLFLRCNSNEGRM